MEGVCWLVVTLRVKGSVLIKSVMAAECSGFKTWICPNLNCCWPVIIEKCMYVEIACWGKGGVWVF